MKIILKNTIQMEDERETVEEVYQGQWHKKGDYQYLTYLNPDGEKVVLKFSEKNLNLTRFAKEKTLMHFSLNHFGNASFPTPMGRQHFLTRTNQLTLLNQQLSLSYDLLLSEMDEEVFAHYDLIIKWEI